MAATTAVKLGSVIPHNPQGDRRLRWLLLPALVAALVYAPTLGFDLVWDDALIRDVPLYRDPALWWEAVRGPILYPSYFRPLPLATMLAEIHILGGSALLAHLTSVTVHAVNTALVAALAWMVWGDRFEGGPRPWVLPVGAGLLYGIHPALVEGVSFVWSRYDLFLTFFLLIALVADRLLVGNPWRAWAVAGAFLLAALSKEMAAGFVLVLPAFHLAAAEAKTWPRIRQVLWENRSVYVAVVGAAFLYLGIRWSALGYLLVYAEGTRMEVGAPLPHLLAVARTLAEMLTLVVWPFFRLSPIHYVALPLTPSDPIAWTSLAALAVGAAVAFFGIRRWPRSIWLAVGGVVALAPVSNIVPLELGGGTLYAERFLVFPAVLFALAAVPLLLPLTVSSLTSRAARVVRVAAVGWLILSLTAIWTTIPNWSSPLRLWTWTTQQAPASSLAWANLALEYIELGEYETGLALADRAIGADPTDGSAWGNRGLGLFRLGRYQEAELALTQAISFEPNDPILWNNLAGALREQGRLQEAEQIILNEVLPREPGLLHPRVNLALVYLLADRPDLARSVLVEVLDLMDEPLRSEALSLLDETNDPARWIRLADLLLAQPDPQGALLALEEAAGLGAPEIEVIVRVTTAWIHMEAWEQADELLRRTLEDQPDEPRLHNNLGIVAWRTDRIDEAAQHFQKAIELAPDWEVPKQNLAALEQE